MSKKLLLSLLLLNVFGLHAAGGGAPMDIDPVPPLLLLDDAAHATPVTALPTRYVLYSLPPLIEATGSVDAPVVVENYSGMKMCFAAMDSQGVFCFVKEEHRCKPHLLHRKLQLSFYTKEGTFLVPFQLPNDFEPTRHKLICRKMTNLSIKERKDDFARIVVAVYDVQDKKEVAVLGLTKHFYMNDLKVYEGYRV